MNDDIISVMNGEADRINAKLNQELIDRYPLRAIQDLQETQREGWMPEIPTQLESDAAYAKRCRDACDKLASALSRIDYACGEPNEMQCSLYDVDCDEVRVIGAVKRVIAELNQRLIDRQESFQAQLVRIEDTWREKLRESQSQVVALRKVNNDYSAHLVDMRAHAKAIIQAHKLSEVDWQAMRAIEAALSIPPPPVVSLEEHEKVVKDAERLADAIGNIGASIRSLQDGEIDQWQAYDAISDIETNALDAHEARKGAAV